MDSSAVIGLTGVIVGAVTSLLASVVVPWVRDGADRRRTLKEQSDAERRLWLMNALSALLEYRQAARGSTERGSAQARFATAVNQLTVRITSEEQPVVDVLVAMFAMVQQPRTGIEDMVGEAMLVLSLWARGDIRTADIISEVERRAGVKFSEDRREVTPQRPQR